MQGHAGRAVPAWTLSKRDPVFFSMLHSVTDQAAGAGGNQAGQLHRVTGTTWKEQGRGICFTM